jgi:hypothetical protein
MPKKKEEVELFDDCPICQAMKEGKAGTEEELKEAFRKAKEKGAVVGGKWFDEE